MRRSATFIAATAFCFASCGPEGSRRARVNGDAALEEPAAEAGGTAGGGRGGAGGRADAGGGGGAGGTAGAGGSGGGAAGAAGGAGGAVGGAGGAAGAGGGGNIDAAAPSLPDAAISVDARAPGADATTTRDAAPVDLRADLSVDMRTPRADGAVDAAAPCPPAAAAGDVIADFASGTLEVKAAGGRGPQGWQVFTDGTPGSQMLRLDAGAPRCGTPMSLRLTGAGFTSWGVALNGLFKPPVEDRWQEYDASAYKGVRFWARAATNTRILVKLPDRNTQRTGGVCTVCDDSFGKFVEVTPEWQQFTVLFTETTQLGFGDKVAAVAPSALYAFELIAPKESSFDLFVDDIAFVPK